MAAGPAEIDAAAIALMLAAGRAAWPKVAIADELFAAHVLRHASREVAVTALHASDLFLAGAVCARDRAALAAFEEHFMARVPDYILRVRVGHGAVDEIQQKLRETLVMGRDGASPKLRDYAGRGALGGWLRVAAVRTALNHVRDQRAAGEGASGEPSEDLALAGDPELAYVKEHAGRLFDEAFREVLAGLDTNDRAILRLHYLEGLTMDQLARLYRMPRSTVARRVAEARAQILAATETFLRDERRLSPSAVASVLRQARSRLEITVRRLLD